MHACVTTNTPFVLTGSIRDDGPLPEVITDAIAAQDAMRAHAIKATMAILIATALHAIATGNMLPAFVTAGGRLAARAGDDLRRLGGVRREQAQGPRHASGVRRRDERTGLHAHPSTVRRARDRSARACRHRDPGCRAGRGRAVMDETRARFLAAIAKQLPAERIAEVHLFAAIRQGGRGERRRRDRAGAGAGR